jgi:hypothetical protein
MQRDVFGSPYYGSPLLVTMDTTAPIATITITTAMFTAGTTGANGEPWASDREVRNPRDLQLIAWPQLDFPLRPVALYLWNGDLSHAESADEILVPGLRLR